MRLTLTQQLKRRFVELIKARKAEEENYYVPTMSWEQNLAYSRPNKLCETN